MSVNVLGYLSAELGLGEAARGLMTALASAGVATGGVDLSDITRSPRRAGPALHGLDDASTNLVCINPAELSRLLVQHGPSLLAHRTNVAAWWWEMPEIPPTWGPLLSLFDEVWAGSRYVQAAIAPTSPVPVVHIPPLVAPGAMRRPAWLDGLDGEAFTVVCVFDYLSEAARKNPSGLIRAFRSAFGPEDGARLVIKTLNEGHRPAEARALRAEAGDGVVIVDGCWPRDEVLGLLAAADCVVSLHRAEGFGLVLAEAMALGTPVIATGYSGNLDFMSDDNSGLVRHTMIAVDAHRGAYGPSQRWAEPDVAHAARLLRDVFESPEAARARAARGRADIARTHSAAAVGTAMTQRLASLAQQAPAFGETAPPLLDVGRWSREARFGPLGRLAKRLLGRALGGFAAEQNEVNLALFGAIAGLQRTEALQRAEIAALRARLEALQGVPPHLD